jgi:BlaI family penicillinase repressor
MCLAALQSLAEEHREMPRRATGRPTDGELEILRVLWEIGPSTPGAVRDVLARDRPVAYTTVQRMLQIMADKRLVSVDRKQRPHVFRPRDTKAVVVGRLVHDLLTRALDGSASQLLLRALEGRRTPPEEFERVRQVLDALEKERRDAGAGDASS